MEKFCFHSNPKERQCQKMLKLPHNCTHLTCQQGKTQNPSSQASTLHEPRNSRYTGWIQKRQRNQRSNCQHLLDHRKSKSFIKTSISALLTMPKPLALQITVYCSMASSNCCFLIYIQVSQETGKVVWYSHLLKNFPQFFVIHTKALAQSMKQMFFWNSFAFSMIQQCW